MPADWEATDEVDCVTLVRSGHPGSLQISAARKPRGLVTERDLKEFATEGRDQAPPLQTVTYSILNGLYSEQTKKGMFSREWWLARNDLLIYVTYNVPQESKEKQPGIIDQIVETIVPNEG
jgi:hypothetical protein